MCRGNTEEALELRLRALGRPKRRFRCATGIGIRATAHARRVATCDSRHWHDSALSPALVRPCRAGDDPPPGHGHGHVYAWLLWERLDVACVDPESAAHGLVVLMGMRMMRMMRWMNVGDGGSGGGSIADVTTTITNHYCCYRAHYRAPVSVLAWLPHMYIDTCTYVHSTHHLQPGQI